jgi:D-arabinose 1-dehydrogenase-like Zn-dependent alcohol dehydrogenase
MSWEQQLQISTEVIANSPFDAPILCAGITVFNSIRKQNITLGELVAIQGLGGLGHLAVQCE